MITIVMTEMCQGCVEADLELDYNEQYMGKKNWWVKCNHRQACEAMHSRTLKMMEEKKINESHYPQ